jgi:hypothetical protein
MAMMDVIDDLDRCKIALQSVAEMQSDSLTTIFELLLGRLEDAIGQVHAQLHQGPCQAPSPRRAPSVPAHPDAVTLLPGRRHTSRRPARVDPEGRPSGDKLQAPRETGA